MKSSSRHAQLCEPSLKEHAKRAVKPCIYAVFLPSSYWKKVELQIWSLDHTHTWRTNWSEFFKNHIFYWYFQHLVKHELGSNKINHNFVLTIALHKTERLARSLPQFHVCWLSGGSHVISLWCIVAHWWVTRKLCSLETLSRCREMVPWCVRTEARKNFSFCLFLAKMLLAHCRKVLDSLHSRNNCSDRPMTHTTVKVLMLCDGTLCIYISPSGTS